MFCSNTSTGGAAMQHLASGGFCSAARSRGVSESGRCTTQMRSYLSVAMPETWPRIQLLGSGLGQNGSTWNWGSGVWADAALTVSAVVAAASHAIIPFMTSSRPSLRASPRMSGSSVAQARWGLHRLHGHHAGHRLDRSGDLRGDLEAAGQL